MTEQRHKYDYVPEPNSAPARVIRAVGLNKRVLELGTGPGSMTRLLKDSGCRVTGMELDEDAIKIAGQYCERIYRCDLDNPAWPSVVSDAKFEVVVVADVLEHLYDPWAVLKSVPGLLAENGYAVVSLPHSGHNSVITCLLSGNFDYQPRGLLDKTHIRFFGIKNIKQLFADAGLKIVAAEFVIKKPKQTEFAERWRRLPVSAKVALSFNRFGTIYHVVVKAVPQYAPGEALDLELLPIPRPDDQLLKKDQSLIARARDNRILKFLGSFVSRETRQRVVRMLERIGLKP